jgi:hypothetical protein
MNKITKYLIGILLLAFLAASCKKEEKPDDKYPLSYKIEVVDPENVVLAVKMYTGTDLPRENLLHYTAFVWHKKTEYDDPHYLRDYYALLAQPQDPIDTVYVGCIYCLDVSIISDIYPRGWATYRIKDTIREISQAKTILFRWPADTAKYQYEWGSDKNSMSPVGHPAKDSYDWNSKKYLNSGK